MNRIRLSVIILALAVICGTALRIVGTAGKKTIDPDEGISYMVATGHLGEYFGVDEQAPYGAWVEASEWKRFLRVEEKFCFKRIGFDLAHYDIHPPLYFWLLHLWSLIFGVHLWTGASLNILISVMAIPLLYRLANQILNNAVEAAMVAFIWALSPSVMGIACHARPYDLLALCTILLVRQTVRCADTSRPFRLRQCIYMAISSAAGALTHYYFMIVILGSGLFWTYRLIKVNRRRLFGALSSAAAGLVIFYLMHPHFLLSIKYQMTENQPFQLHDMVTRLKVIIATLGTFFWQGRPAIYVFPPATIFKYIYPTILLLVICFLLMLYIRSRQNNHGRLQESDQEGYLVLYFFLWTAGIIILSYIFFLSPAHAMGPKYLSIVWPFLAFIPVFIIRRFGRFRLTLMFLLVSSQTLFGSLDMIYMNYPDDKRPEPVAWLKDSEMLLVDNVARGVLPGIVWHVPNKKSIFAANQSYLLENTGRWKSKLTENSVYLSVLLYGNTPGRQQEIVDLMGREYQMRSSSGGFWGYGNMFRLEKRITDSIEN